MKLFYLFILCISFHCNAQTEEPTEDGLKINSTGKINFVENIQEAKNLAKTDIANKTPFLFIHGGWAPVVYATDKSFEKKYNAYFSDFGCTSPDQDLLSAYNFTVFKYLDDQFGKRWRKEIRKDVIGFNEYKKKAVINSGDTKEMQPTISKLDSRFSIVGDFNGDSIKDTIFESYRNSISKKEINKIHDSLDWEKDIELTLKSKPISILYSSDKSVHPFIVSKNYQQKGVYLLSNLGDLNDDGKDEFGYAVDWADFSSLNTYRIMTIKQNMFVEIFNFPLHETMSVEPGNLFHSKEMVLKVSKKTIRYKYASMEDGDVKEAEYTFK